MSGAAQGRHTTPASRSLGLTGATNFRDLGGYIGHGGRGVRWRRLYRSDHLGNLTDRDRAEVAALGVARTFDFRGIGERAEASYHLPGIVQHPLPIEPTVVQSLLDIAAQGRELTGDDAIEVMRETYRWFVRENASRYAELFGHLLEHDAPLVFHCTAGKDRTGLAAALILHALGVSRDDVIQDFLLTNALYRRPATTARADVPDEVLDVVWQVRLEFLDAAWQAMDAGYGGPDDYLLALGVGERERERLRGLYLDDAG